MSRRAIKMLWWTTTTFLVVVEHHNLFMALFLLDFMLLGRITRGRNADSLGGLHSIWTNEQSISFIFTPDAIPVATLPI